MKSPTGGQLGQPAVRLLVEGIDVHGPLQGFDGARTVPGRFPELRLLQIRLQEGLVDPGQGLELAQGAGAVALLHMDACEQPARAAGSRVFREQVAGPRQVLLGLVEPVLIEELRAHCHLRHEVVGMGRRQPPHLVRGAGAPFGQRGQGLGGRQRSGEAFLEVVREDPVEALDLRAEHPFEHLLGGGARRVLAEHGHQRLGPVIARDQLADQ